MLSMTVRERFSGFVEDVAMATQRVLVVDDEEDLLELVQYNLSKEGFQVRCVSTGEAAIQEAKAFLPDLILLDLHAAGRRRAGGVQDHQDDPLTQHIPIVMVTAKTEDADVVSGLELGADDYITKPFSPRVMLARICAVLRRKQADVRRPRRAGDPRAGDSPRTARSVAARPAGRSDLHRISLAPILGASRAGPFLAVKLSTRSKAKIIPVTERSVDVQVAGLRKKLGGFGSYIETGAGLAIASRNSHAQKSAAVASAACVRSGHARRRCSSPSGSH